MTQQPAVAVDPTTKIALSLSINQINFILQILAQRPYNEVADAINDLRKQASIKIATAGADAGKSE
jgi:hypothetical protein